MENTKVKKYLRIDLPEQDDLPDLSWAELHEWKIKTRQAADSLLDRSKASGRDLSEDEDDAFDHAVKFLGAIQTEIDTRSAEDRKDPRPLDEPLRPIPNSERNRKMENMFAPRKSWRSIFGREPRPTGMQNFGEAIRALHHGDTAKLAELRTMNAINGSEGGFAVPENWWAQVYDSGIEASVALDKVQVYPMTSNVLHVAGWDSADHTTGPIGAVVGEWLGETATATRVTPNLRTVKFEARKLAMFIAASSECLQDSAAINSSLAMLMRNSLAFSLDQAILTGSAVGQPLGVLMGGATIASARATAGQISFADVVGMVGRMLPSSLDKCMWLCSPSAFATLSGMVVTSGTGVLAMGYLPGASDVKMSILGKPLRVTEKLPALGEAGDLMLVDLSYYGLGMRESGRFEKTNGPSWTSDVVDFRFIIRCDGKPLIAQPFTPAGGGATLSPFVALAA